MRPRPAAPAGPVAVLAALVLVGAWLVAGPDDRAQAQPRRVVVVGDSIVLGAQGPVVDGFRGAGWEVTFDAAVSRSTAAGAEAVSAHAAELTDSLVVGLGANDAGNTASFRQRVEQVMAAAAWVPHVYWLTIPEVRPYYGPANQVLRDAAAAHPNLRVLDWHDLATQPGLTAGDGLHLTPAGARAMAFLVVAGTVAGGTPTTLPPPTVPPPTPPPAPEPVAPPVTEAPTTLPPTTVPQTVPPTAPPTTSTPPRRPVHGRGSSRDPAAGADGAPDTTSSGSAAALRAGLAALLLGAVGLVTVRLTPGTDSEPQR